MIYGKNKDWYNRDNKKLPVYPCQVIIRYFKHKEWYYYKTEFLIRSIK